MPLKLYLTYDASELSDHAAKAIIVAKQDEWEVTDAPSIPPSNRRSVSEHDGLLVLSGWAHNPPAGPTQQELDWEAARKAGIPCRAVLVDEKRPWWPTHLKSGMSASGLSALREKLRPFASDLGFELDPQSISPIVQQQLALLRQEVQKKKAGAKTFVVWDFTIDGLDLILSALRKDPPKEVDIQIPGLDPAAGQILSNVIVPGIQNNDRVLVVTDRPNANVAFELGLALGCGKQVALVHVGARVPDWLQESPMRGYVVNAVGDVKDIRIALQDPQRWYSPPQSAPVPRYGGTLFLCPGRYLGAALREEQQRAIDQGAWISIKTTSDLDSLNNQCAQVSQVIWSIAPYTEGSDSRDGAENAANGVVAGWFFARGCKTFGLDGAKERVSVLHNVKSREVLDVVPISGKFSGLDSYATLLQEVPDRLPPVSAGTKQYIGSIKYEVVQIKPLPEDPNTQIWAGVAPVTNEQYMKFCEETHHPLPKYITEGQFKPDTPVVEVSAVDAQEFCKWLGQNCDLPGRDLWWHFAREGKKEGYWWGTDSSLLTRVSWGLANAGGSIHPVKKKRASTWGLHDIFGNVDEWTKPYQEKSGIEVGYGTSTVWRANALGGAYNMSIESFSQERVLQAQRGYPNVGFRCIWFE